MAEDREEKDQEDRSEAEASDNDTDGNEKYTFSDKLTRSKFSKHKQAKYESKEGGSGP